MKTINKFTTTTTQRSIPCYICLLRVPDVLLGVDVGDVEEGSPIIGKHRNRVHARQRQRLRREARVELFPDRGQSQDNVAQNHTLT